MANIPVYDLQNKRIVDEKVYGGDLLRNFYSKPYLRAIIERPWAQKFVSRVFGVIKKSAFSRNQVDAFVKTFEVSLEGFQVPEGGFESFNDFFIRKKKSVTFPANYENFPSACDARLSLCRIDNGIPKLNIKGREILLPDLLGNSGKFTNPKKGWALTFRLCPLDYHRFHFVDSGMVSAPVKLGTMLHSVNPWALEALPKIFEWNERQVCEQQSDHYGKIVYIEVGAMCVGRIHQTYSPKKRAARGQEKGYFEFGASTLVVLLEDGEQKFSPLPVIQEKNAEGLEVVVRLGEKIGEWR